jgi:heterodisulfide reductase subunit A-like polyferredoxin
MRFDADESSAGGQRWRTEGLIRGRNQGPCPAAATWRSAAELLALSAGYAGRRHAVISARHHEAERQPGGVFHRGARQAAAGGHARREGIFLCGTAHGPKLISETISQAQAAASRAATFLARPEIKLSAIAATVDTDDCVKCLTCVRTCPFDVPVFNTEKPRSHRDRCRALPRLRGLRRCVPAADDPAGLLRR